jgi:hypothetical protein
VIVGEMGVKRSVETGEICRVGVSGVDIFTEEGEGQFSPTQRDRKCRDLGPHPGRL